MTSARPLGDGETRSHAPAIESLGRRLRMVLGMAIDVQSPTPPVTTAPLPPEVEFIGYADDCLLVGHIRMDAARLSDLLNDHDEYQLVDVQVESLVDQHAIEVKDIVVARDELLMVHAGGPRGERGRRVRTRQHPLAMQVGPYNVHGYLHALPGSDPVASFRRRKPMVPLTDAWIEYQQATLWQRRRVATLIVNRHQVDWVVEGHDEEAEMPDVALHVEGGPLLKDFTGQMSSGRSERNR